MPERIITAGFFAFKGEKNGKPRAYRGWEGDIVDLSDAEAARGDALGVLAPVATVATSELVSSAARASEPFTVEWLEASTAAEVLDAVDGDPDMAKSLASIEAGRDKPRTSLVDRLHKIK